jgi:hypothetical protein
MTNTPTTPEAPSLNIIHDTVCDEGRRKTIVTLYVTHEGEYHRIVLGAYAKRPKVYVEHYGKDRAYVANNWRSFRGEGENEVHEFRTLSEAKAYFVALASEKAKEVAK